ncbi:MAG: hypothetical protein AAFX01_14350 [Cyanobacteria bacterium J06638_28]
MTNSDLSNANRSLTLKGVNSLFSVLDIEIKRNEELSIYEASYRGLDYQGKTLVAIGQQLLRAISEESPI